MSEPSAQKRLPYFSCYPDKLEADLRTLSPDVAGRYMILLCWMWRNGVEQCSVEHSTSLLFRVLGCSKKALTRFLDEVTHETHPLLKAEGNMLVSNGLRKAHTQAKAKQDAGIRSAEARAKRQQNVSSDPNKPLHPKAKAKAKTKAEVLRPDSAGDGRKSEPVAVGEVVANALSDDQWSAWELPMKANSFELDSRHGYWCKVEARLRIATGSDDWFEARLNEARDRTTGQWMHKYSGPIEGNPAAWLNSQCQAMLKGEWK